MEILLPVFLFLFVHLIATAIILRHFCKQISNKINFITQENPQEPHEEPVVPQLSKFKLAESNGTSAYRYKPQSTTIDESAPNLASAADQNDMELNEQNLTGLPADVKLAVEGGDVHVPPEYEERRTG